MVNLDQIDWASLERLRAGFLSGEAASGPYWRARSDLESYDATFGERIGWKWDSVLRELARRNWRPSSRNALDWGCGSGIAGRRVIETFGPENFDSLDLWDHSPLDMQPIAPGKVSPRSSSILLQIRPIGRLPTIRRGSSLSAMS